MPDLSACRQPALTTIVAIAIGLSSSAQAGEERFRPSRDSMLLDDYAGNPPARDDIDPDLPYEVIQGYAIAEGDMVLGRVDADGRLPPRFQTRGLGQSNAFDRWPDGVIPFDYDPQISDIQRSNVDKAIARINARTSILLVPRDAPEADPYNFYLKFQSSDGSCASFVGRQQGETDAQSLWIADNCSVGSVVHEIAHAIGLFHEHTRADRDEFITVNEENIQDSAKINFKIYDPNYDQGTRVYSDYDYGSIMHYGENFFSKNGEPTIEVPSNVLIGQRSQLSDLDIASIDDMYATDLTLSAITSETENGLEIDLSITNQGTLGANSLELRILAQPGSDWLSASADSGWDCLAYDEELRCTRQRLIEQANSRFTVVADPANTDSETLAFKLTSRTLDTDPSSNGINEDRFPPESTDDGLDLGSATPVSESQGDEGGDRIDTAERDGSRPADGDSGGGGNGGLPILLVLSGLGLLRSRRR